MKLPIGCPIWNPLKHEYYSFLSIHVYSNLPKIGRQCNPPPGMKKLDTDQSDILFLAAVPPPPRVKKLDTGQSDILVLTDVPPPQIEIGLNMNAIGKKSFQERSSSTFYQSTPPFHYHYLILCLNRKLVNFNFKWVYGFEPHPPALSSQQNKMLILDYVQLLVIGWAGQWTQTPSTTPLQPKN